MQLPCDFCGEWETQILYCKICGARYCNEYCMNEDVITHKAVCKSPAKSEMVACLKFFGMELENFNIWQDEYENPYIHLPGKIPFHYGKVPFLMMDLYEPHSKARNIWKTFNLPQCTLDVSCYLVKVDDIPRMFRLLKKEQLDYLSSLLELRNPRKKKPSV